MEDAGKLNPRVEVLDENSNPVVASDEAAGQNSNSANAGNASTSSNTQQRNYQPRHRFVVLEGADHFYNTLMYNHQEKLYTEILSFLRNDCGPDGL